MRVSTASRSVFGRTVLSMVAGVALLAFATPETARAQGYGSSATVADGTVLVGEPMNERRPGTVYVYERGPDGSWSETGQLRAADGEAGDRFGRALAYQDGVVWAGATSVDSSRGAVYLLEQDGSGGWSQMAKLRPADVEPEEAFGRAVAVDGDVALVSSAGKDSARGAVYVYRRGGSGEWTQTGKLTAGDGSPDDLFGISVALRGDRALVGAPGASNRAGAAYVFQYDAEAGSWSQTGKLQGSTAGQNSTFGGTLLIQDDRLLVGAPGHGRFSGAVFVYEWSDEDSGWKETARLLPFDGAQGTQFGSSLVAMGDELWAGAPGAGDGGTVYRFRRSGDGYASVTKFTPEDVERGDGFAATLSAGDGIAVAGLTGDDYGAGTALIMERGDAGWAAADKVWSELENYAAVTGGAVACGSDGVAAHFDCQNVDLLSFLPVGQIGGSRGVRMSDIWGWTDPETGREYALAGRMDGTAFVDVTEPTDPRYLGSLPLTEGARPSSWRDIKVYQDHAFIVADNAGEHGIQIFDLTRLRDVSTSEAPVTFEEDAHYDRVHSVHNIVINPETGYAYAVGSSGGGQSCGGGLHMIDIREPTSPTFAGCFADSRTGRSNTGYTHDAQCVVYQGPDQEHAGKEICIGANETAVSVADVSDKQNPQAISVATYPNYGYVHQGWFGPDQRYFYLDDELDELQGKVDSTRTMVWDMSDLDDPILATQFTPPTRCSDHNLYVIGDRVYQSNYQCGFRVLDISDPVAPAEVGYLDTVPYGENAPSFGGSWSNFPFFESGTVVVNSGNEGLLVVQPTGPAAASSRALKESGPVRSARSGDGSGETDGSR